eukprot:scaffold12694_cov32-Tisochrysis_lutea.AAC.2
MERRTDSGGGIPSPALNAAWPEPGVAKALPGMETLIGEWCPPGYAGTWCKGGEMAEKERRSCSVLAAPPGPGLFKILVMWRAWPTAARGSSPCGDAPAACCRNRWAAAAADMKRAVDSREPRPSVASAAVVNAADTACGAGSHAVAAVAVVDTYSVRSAAAPEEARAEYAFFRKMRTPWDPGLPPKSGRGVPFLASGVRGGIGRASPGPDGLPCG